MKKNIILGVAFMIMSLHQLAAQDSTQVAPTVSQRFEESFKGASNVHWTSLAKNVSQAQFVYQGGSWLAYFDKDGNLLTSGRKISSIEQLPLSVQSGFRRAKARMERKTGSFRIALIYEMVKDDVTKYYISMQNDAIRTLLSVRTDGATAIETKKFITREPTAPKDVIAKKN